MMKVNKIPSKIDPDPIITAVIEVRFKTAIPESTVVGVIYGELIVDYPNFKNFVKHHFFLSKNAKNYYNTGQKADYITKRLIRKVRIELLCDSL